MRCLPRLIANGVRAPIKSFKIVVEVSKILELNKILFSRFESFRHLQNVELSGSVIYLFHDFDDSIFVKIAGVFHNAREFFINFHVDGMETYIFSIHCDVHYNADLS